MIKKIAALLVIFFALLIFAQMLFVEEILVDENYYTPLLWSVLPISLLLDVFILYLYFSGNKKYINSLRIQTKRVGLTTFGACIFVPMFVFGLLCHSFPTIIHHVSPKFETSMTVTVNYKYSSYKDSGRFSKNGRVRLQEYSYIFNSDIWGLQKADWDKIDSGSKLELFGQKSFIGFDFQKYKVLTNL